MKKWFLNMLVVGVLGTFAVSCSDEYDGLSQELDSNKAQVVFSVAMDTPSTRSRATDTWGDDFTPSAPGDEYDNRIDLEQFIIKIESEGKTYPITDVIKWKEKDSEVNEYKFVGVVQGMTSSVTLENVKINVYANMGSNPDADFGTMTFGQDAENIPMWGVLTADKLEFAPGKRTELPTTISLLRAMAKFQVGISDAMIDKGYALTAASLNKFNPIGNCMPSGYATADNTTAMGQESVLNENTTGQVEATALPVAETGKSYVAYLPEISNTSDSELKMLLTFTKGDTERIETEVSVKDYSADNTGLLNIVRNHWYKYVISDIVNSEPVVEYSTVEWINKEIEVGGEGFLVLNKDVIEIYNANIDANQLKFSSSSPIKSIILKDLYTHDRDGNIVEGTTDGVSAYYISKYGQKIQLGTDPGFDISDKDAALAREAVILSKISATAETNTLNGGITITSPFMADPASEVHELQQNSHYDTPRYLEFLVTNEQDLTATFRVMQYPPVVVTNEEGYFSYRSDQKYSEDQEEASHFHNYMGGKSFHCTGLYFYHEHDWSKEIEMTEEWWSTNRNDRDYSWVDPISCPDNQKNTGSDIVNYGHIANPVTYYKNGKLNSGLYAGIYKPTVTPTEPFLRWRYSGISGTNNDSQGLAISGLYQKEDGKWYRKHYVWNVQIIFYNRYVNKVYQNDDLNAKRLKGQADIHCMYHATPAQNMTIDSPGTGWASWGKQGFTNHRMYNVRVTSSQDDYVIGYPIITEEGETKNTSSNANMVSPNFMVASQLGETYHQSVINSAAGYGYKVPVVGEFYKIAVQQCREYVETTYTDLNNDNQWNEGEPVIHYDDWRLPTKEEINKIIELQNSSRAMDKLLTGQYYFCVAGGDVDADVNVKENWVSNEVPGFDEENSKGYYIRCVRDVKPGEKENK